MSVLNRKLIRDLGGSVLVLLTVVAIIAVGTGSFIGLRSSQRILESSQSSYYADYQFADFWVDVKKAPLPAIERIASLPGVAAIEARVVFDVILDLPGEIQPLTGRLISMPPGRLDRTLNGICLVQGSGFSDDRDEEVIVSEAFAQAHKLEPGDRITLILNRKRQSFVIVGTAISPEYVYMVRGEGDFLPDPEHFGVLYVKARYAREVLDFKDSCNQVVGRLLPGYTGEVDLLLDRIDRMLDEYGVLATTPRARQASHRFLSDEIRGLGISAALMPTIFLVVAALVLNIIMSRLAERQRSIVGTLKAIGYSNRQVLFHFMGFGVVIGLIGGAAGIVLGLLMAWGLIEMYREFFEFPAFLFRLYPDLLLMGMVISLVFAVGGTAKGVATALKLRPAEAMRPKPPERGGSIFLERFPALWRRLGFRTHIALRGLARNRVRTGTVAFSSALATSIIFMSLAMYDAMFFLVDFQFEQVLRSDVDIGMRDARSRAAVFEARRLPGVDEAEPVLGLTCDVRHGRRSRRLTILGLSHDHDLTVPRTPDLEPVVIPREGLVFSKELAEMLGVEPGDTLSLTPIRGRRQTVRARLASVAETYLGLASYADLDYLSRIVGEAAAVNSLQLAVNNAAIEELYREVKELPNAQGLSRRADTRENIEATMLETMTASLGMMILLAGVIAFGSMLNGSLIEIADRTRDIATFRVLGYRPGQVAGIFFRQNMIVFALGLALGLPLGYAMVRGAVQAYDSELFRMPVVVKRQTVVITAVISIVFILIAQAFVYRQILRMDWQEGVKVKE